jgi:hypothetical protein
VRAITTAKAYARPCARRQINAYRRQWSAVQTQHSEITGKPAKECEEPHEEQINGPSDKLYIHA